MTIQRSKFIYGIVAEMCHMHQHVVHKTFSCAAESVPKVSECFPFADSCQACSYRFRINRILAQLAELIV